MNRPELMLEGKMGNLLKARPLRRALADVLSVVVPKSNAGACTDQPGSDCGCESHFIGCDAYRCYYSYYKLVFNCNGSCRSVGNC